MNKALEIIKKVTDVVTILGPAISMAVGIFDTKGVIIVDGASQIALICLDAAAAVCSILFNVVDKKLTASKS